MRSGKELVGSFAILLVIQALTSLVAIALLSRMSPAIERILEENSACSAETIELMQDADDEAKRLGFAGAWAAAILGLVGLGASLLAIGRARRRIVAPLAEMARVVDAHEAGELHRRCTLPEASGPEPARVLMALNELYDRRDRDTEPIGAAANVDRALVLTLLDARDEAIAVVDEGGELVAANARAEALFAGAGGASVRETLRRAAREGDDPGALPGIARVEPVRDSGARMCVLREREDAGR